jgi:hypothetical protein
VPKPTYPLCGQRQFLETLAPYLPYGIDIFHPATGRTGWLRGLPATYEGQELPLADVEFYADVDAKAEGGGDLLECASKILPVLYSFEDLATEITLADGRRVVPAVEVAKLECEVELADAEFQMETEYYICARAKGRSWEMWHGAQWFIGGGMRACTAAWLRAAHFAVGLAPTQYKRKEVARG